MIILLTGTIAILLLAAQAPAWQAGNMERGAVSSVQQPYGQGQNSQQLRSEIASTRAELNLELNRNNPNMDKVRELNRKLARDRQNLRRMMQERRHQPQPRQRGYRHYQRPDGGWGMQRGRGRGGHMGGGHMGGGHMR
jgi:hypothetical protein